LVELQIWIADKAIRRPRNRLGLFEHIALII
jgi:hypothetical protein